MGGISIWQLLIILVIVVLLFGTKRLKGIGTDLGGAIKGFKKAVVDAFKCMYCRTQKKKYTRKLMSFFFLFFSPLFHRIPSNTSVASHGSASTADRPFSKCSSPLPIYSVQYLLPDGRAEQQRIPRK